MASKPTQDHASVEIDVPYSRQTGWIPTLDDAWKLNFAGYIDEAKSAAGAGCLLRDQNAVFIAAGAGPLKGCDNQLMADLMALRSGLDIATKLGVEYLEIEGDRLITIRMVRGNIKPISEPIERILSQCRDFIGGFRSVRIKHVCYRNTEAVNFLASRGSQLPGSVLWDEPPPIIAPILIRDVIGHWVHP